MSNIQQAFDSRKGVWRIKDIFDFHRFANDDFSAHMDYCAEISKGKRVLDMGFRWGQSTAAFLVGAKSVKTFDINECLEGREIFDEAVEVDKAYWEFVWKDSLSVDPEECDILFIDTDHTGDQVYAELTLHHAAVNDGGLIVMHDTQAFSSMRNGIRQFISENEQWGVLKHFVHSNGLTVLHRGRSEEAL
tara:strand:+ start:532 stop:1101 length:570 start_codon:yes stop_codon:yes gene_type:complete